MNRFPGFLVIDDDPVNNRICEIVIKRVLPDAVIKTFIDPEAGLEYVEAHFKSGPPRRSVLLLDINMPTLSGWDVLAHFRTFPEELLSRYKIYILSSSVDEQDKERADNSPLVCGYIEKPLTLECIETISAEAKQWIANG